jgi:hypothetical protein
VPASQIEWARILVGALVHCHVWNSAATRAQVEIFPQRDVALTQMTQFGTPPHAADGASGADASTLTVRWLAQECGLPPAPAPHLASAAIADAKRADAAIAHLAWWSRHADAGSNFARATRDLADGADAQRVAALLARGYDGLLYCDGGAIAGHFFFQRHGDEMHAFAGWSAETLRASGLIASAALDFIAYASAADGIVRVRVGTGAHPIAHRLLAPVAPVAARLGWRLREGCWLDF